MYTLEQLEQNYIKELKEIGWQFNVLPKGDKRCRQNWIDALVGVNPPLLQLLEVSPAVSVEQVQEPIEVQAQEPPIESKFGRIVYPRPTQKLIELAAETSPGVEVDPVWEPIAQVIEISPGVEVDRVQEPIAQAAETPPGVEVDRVQEPIGVAPNFDYLDCPICGSARSLFVTSPGLVAFWETRCVYCDYIKSSTKHPFEDSRPPELPAHMLDFLPIHQSQDDKPIAQAAQTSPGVEVDSVHEPIAQAAEISPGVEVDPVSEPIAQTAEISLGVENFIEADRPPNRGDNGRDRLEIELKLSQSAIELVSEIFSGVERVTESNRNNFSGVERVTESNRNNFSGVERVTESNRNNFSGVERVQKRKSIPHELLELFNSSVYRLGDVHESQRQEPTSLIPSQLGELIEQVVENSLGVTFSPGFLACYSPPQSENILFRLETDGQLSLLDFEVQSQSEPPDPDDFESIDVFREALARWDFEHPEELAASLDSMCEWAPCPADWYEFDTPREPSEVSELSRELELSQVLELSTSNFSIPTFSAEGVSPNRTDEPPDTGLCARLPKPKPPSFPPTVAGHAYQTYTKRRSNASQTQSKRIPNSLNLLCQSDRSSFLELAYCGAIAVGRAPPGGDAM